MDIEAGVSVCFCRLLLWVGGLSKSSAYLSFSPVSFLSLSLSHYRFLFLRELVERQWPLDWIGAAVMMAVVGARKLRRVVDEVVAAASKPAPCLSSTRAGHAHTYEPTDTPTDARTHTETYTYTHAMEKQLLASCPPVRRRRRRRRRRWVA